MACDSVIKEYLRENLDIRITHETRMFNSGSLKVEIMLGDEVIAESNSIDGYELRDCLGSD